MLPSLFLDGCCPIVCCDLKYALFLVTGDCYEYSFAFLGVVMDSINAMQAFYGGRWGMKIESRCFRESKADKWTGYYGGSTSEW